MYLETQIETWAPESIEYKHGHISCPTSSCAGRPSMCWAYDQICVQDPALGQPTMLEGTNWLPHQILSDSLAWWIF